MTAFFWPGFQRNGKESPGHCLPGSRGANLVGKPRPGWSRFAGAQFRDEADHHLQVLDKQAKLDLSKSVFLADGIKFSF